MSNHRVIHAALSVALVLAGCGSGGPAGDNGSGSNDASGDPDRTIIVMNGDDPAYFWLPASQKALQALAAAPLTDAGGDMVDTALLDDPEGRALLSYVAACALPAGTALESRAASASFAGALGLAPSWPTTALADVATQRWVTACLLQTLNGLGAKVPVAMRGDHPALADDPPDPDASGFTTPDGTMFGNVLGPSAHEAFACTDSEVLAACGVDFSASLLKRICGLSPTCGVELLGVCDLSCERNAAGHPRCVTPAGGAYPEAIATTLESDLRVFPGVECGPGAAGDAHTR